MTVNATGTSATSVKRTVGEKDGTKSGVAEGVRDWSDHLRKPRPDNYWSDQNFENIRL